MQTANSKFGDAAVKSMSINYIKKKNEGQILTPRDNIVEASQTTSFNFPSKITKNSHNIVVSMSPK